MNLIFLTLVVVLAIVLYRVTHTSSSFQAGTLQFFGGSNNSYISYDPTTAFYPNDSDSPSPSSSFTLESWIKMDPSRTVGNGVNSAPRPFVLSGTKDGTGSQILGVSIEGSASARTLYVWINGVSPISCDFPVDFLWHHLAIVGETATKLSIYIDGIRAETTLYSYNIYNEGGFVNGSKHFNVGSYPEDPQPTYTSFVGYLANLRYNTTTAIYSGASFEVPKQAPTAIPGTVLLLLATDEATKFTDSSNLGLTATSYGDPAPTWSSQTLSN